MSRFICCSAAALFALMVFIPPALCGEDFEKGRYMEEALGDLPGAIACYRNAVKSVSDPVEKARALFRIGACFEKLSDMQKARAAYQNILDLEGVPEDSRAGAAERLSVMRSSADSAGSTLEGETLLVDIALFKTAVSSSQECLAEARTILLNKTAMLQRVKTGEIAPDSMGTAISGARLLDKFFHETDVKNRVRTLVALKYFNAAFAQYAALEYESALCAFQKALELDPSLPEPAQYIRRILYILGEIEGPVSGMVADKSAAADDADAVRIETLVAAGKKALEAKDFRSALRHFEAARDAATWSTGANTNPQASALLEDASRGLDDSLSGLTQAESARLRSLLDEKTVLVQALQKAVEDIFACFQAVEAVEIQFRRLAVGAAAGATSRGEIAARLIEDAQNALLGAELDAARTLVKRALEIDPSNAAALRFIADLGASKAAGPLSSSLIERLKDAFNRSFEEGIALYDRGELREAREKFQRVLRLHETLGRANSPAAAAGRARRLLEELQRRLAVAKPEYDVFLADVGTVIGENKPFADGPRLKGFLEKFACPPAGKTADIDVSARKNVLAALGAVNGVAQIREIVGALLLSPAYTVHAQIAAIGANESFFKDGAREYKAAAPGFFLASLNADSAGEYLAAARVGKSAVLIGELPSEVFGAGVIRAFEFGRNEEYIAGFEKKLGPQGGESKPVLEKAFRGVRVSIRALPGLPVKENESASEAVLTAVEIEYSYGGDAVQLKTPDGLVQMPQTALKSASFLVRIPNGSACLILGGANPLSGSLTGASARGELAGVLLTVRIQKADGSAPRK
jgi:tetratricopeptide (TPR) repeat protein